MSIRRFAWAALVLSLAFAHLREARADGAPAPGENSPAADKSPMLAFGLAAVPTVAGYLLMADMTFYNSDSDRTNWFLVGGGLALVGPSVGHFYAGEVGRGLATIGIRALGGGVMLLGVGNPKGEGTNDGLLAAGAVIVGAATLYDLWDAPRAARRASRRVVVAPVALAGPGGSVGWGLGAAAAF